jgi:hypothetical protein
MPTLRKVSPRAEAVLEVVPESFDVETVSGPPQPGAGGMMERPQTDGGEASATVVTGDLAELIEAIHELERYRSNSEAEIRSVKDRMARMTTTISSMDDVRRSLYTLETRMQEVATLFDVLSLDINPFIDYSVPGRPPKDEPFVSEIWILKWLEFLQNSMSSVEIPNLLEYYKEIGWIDDLIESKAMTYLKSLHFAGGPMDKAVTPTGEIIALDRDETDGWKLGTKDTISSYLFIQRIKGVRVDPTVMEDIAEEVKKLLELGSGPRIEDIFVEDSTPEFTIEEGPVEGVQDFGDTPFTEEVEPPDNVEDAFAQDAFIDVPVIDEEELDRLKEKLDHLSSNERG